MQESRTDYYIDRVAGWVGEKFGTHVCDSADVDYYDYENNIILIEDKQSGLSKLCGLLHESGHAILMNNQKNYHSRFPNDLLTNADIVYDEMLAWQKARELAIALNIDIDDDTWLLHRNESIENYIEDYKNNV